MSSLKDYLNNKLDDPEFKKVYESGESAFQIMRAIAESRAVSGLSQKDLAEKAGVSVGTIIALENGTANPSLKTLEKLASAMNMRLVLRFDDISTKD